MFGQGFLEIAISPCHASFNNNIKHKYSKTTINSRILSNLKLKYNKTCKLSLKKVTTELHGLKKNGNEDRPEVIKSACVDHATDKINHEFCNWYYHNCRQISISFHVQIALILCWSATDFYTDLLFRGKGAERQRFKVSRCRLSFYLISKDMFQS